MRGFGVRCSLRDIGLAGGLDPLPSAFNPLPVRGVVSVNLAVDLVPDHPCLDPTGKARERKDDAPPRHLPLFSGSPPLLIRNLSASIVAAKR